MAYAFVSAYPPENKRKIDLIVYHYRTVCRYYREVRNSDHSPSWQFWCPSSLVSNPKWRLGDMAVLWPLLAVHSVIKYRGLYLLDVKVALNPLYVVVALLSLWKCTQTMFPGLWISLGKLLPHIGLSRTEPKTASISTGTFGYWKYASLISRQSFWQCSLCSNSNDSNLIWIWCPSGARRYHSQLKFA